MKTIVIVKNDAFQIDLIPETPLEEAVLRQLQEGAVLRVGKAAGYAECRGHYLRPFDYSNGVGFTYLTQADLAEEIRRSEQNLRDALAGLDG